MLSRNSSNSSMELGNTSPAPKPKKQVSPAKNWCFTWNNYPENWLDLIVPKFQHLKGGIGGLEVCPTTGTPHVQGYIEFKSKSRPFSLDLPKEIRWKAARGSRKQNDQYCSKEGNVAFAFGTLKPKIDMECTVDDILTYEDMYSWGQRLENMVAGCLPEKTDRRIFWFWSEAGCMKKTETARRLVFHHNACIIQGGRKHVLATAYKNAAPIYILTVPRTDEGFVSYASIELLKDALYMSAFGTEATGMVNRKKPWVIVFANFPADTNKLSEDRWVIQNVDI